MHSMHNMPQNYSGYGQPMPQYQAPYFNQFQDGSMPAMPPAAAPIAAATATAPASTTPAGVSSPTHLPSSISVNFSHSLLCADKWGKVLSQDLEERFTALEKGLKQLEKGLNKKIKKNKEKIEEMADKLDTFEVRPSTSPKCLPAAQHICSQ